MQRIPQFVTDKLWEDKIERTYLLLVLKLLAELFDWPRLIRDASNVEMEQFDVQIQDASNVFFLLYLPILQTFVKFFLYVFKYVIVGQGFFKARVSRSTRKTLLTRKNCCKRF